MGGNGSDDVSIVKRNREKSNDYYSDVDSRTTYMSDKDREQVGGSSNWESRYFQSSNSFRLNRALREGAMEGDESVQDSLKAYFGRNWEKQLKTVEAMDRNMRPLNKDINVVRLADEGYLASILKSFNIDNAIKERLIDGAGSWGGSFRQSDVDELNRYLRNNDVVITEPSYMSTTYNTSLSDSAFSRRMVKLELSVKAGRKAMFSPTGEESEMVLARNTSHQPYFFYIDNKGRLTFKSNV